MSTAERTTHEHALSLDRADPLARWRSEFCIPLIKDACPTATTDRDRACVYLCGNSLGLMPKATPGALSEDLEAWARLGVEGHLHAKNPWFPAHEAVRDASARLVGAQPGEVVAMNSLTVNLHLLMASFYRPTTERCVIIMEDSAFPSDSYAIASQAAWHGIDPAKAVVRLRPREGEATLRTDDVLAEIERQGPRLALVVLGGVNYFTGQWFDMPTITAAAQRAGALVGWDLAHAAGNVPLSLHDWNVDFACWCSYKYLNSGPGSLAGAFIHRRHAQSVARFGEPGFVPRLAGWWGNDPKTRFAMEPGFVPSGTADAWSTSNPPIFALTPVRVSLEIFDRVGMSALRSKSEQMAAYLRGLLDALPGAGEVVSYVTPVDLRERGCQVSVKVNVGDPRGLHAALSAAGIVSDFRSPNVVRVAPVPLYNSYEDCWRFAQALRGAMGAQGNGGLR